MSAIKNAFHNAICFQQELMEFDCLDIPEELGEVILNMLDCIEKMEFTQAAMTDRWLFSPCQSDRERILNYKPMLSDEVRESWEDERSQN